MAPYVGSQPFIASCAAFLAVWFGVKFICPSATTLNAPAWYITPATVFGKDELFTLFNTTDATATCPSIAFSSCFCIY